MKQGNNEALEMTATQACKRRGISLNFLYQLLRTGRISGAIKRDGQWVIPASVIEEHVRQRESKMAA